MVAIVKTFRFENSGDSTDFAILYGPEQGFDDSSQRVRHVTELASGDIRVVDHGVRIITLRNINLWADSITRVGQFESWFADNPGYFTLKTHLLETHENSVITNFDGFTKTPGGRYTCTMDIQIRVTDRDYEYGS